MSGDRYTNIYSYTLKHSIISRDIYMWPPSATYTPPPQSSLRIVDLALRLVYLITYTLSLPSPLLQKFCIPQHFTTLHSILLGLTLTLYLTPTSLPLPLLLSSLTPHHLTSSTFLYTPHRLTTFHSSLYPTPPPIFHSSLYPTPFHQLHPSFHSSIYPTPPTIFHSSVYPTPFHQLHLSSTVLNTPHPFSNCTPPPQ